VQVVLTDAAGESNLNVRRSVDGIDVGVSGEDAIRVRVPIARVDDVVAKLGLDPKPKPN
jgi:hypothetical protein